MRILLRVGIAVGVLAAAAAALVFAAGQGVFGARDGAGEIQGAARHEAARAREAAVQQAAQTLAAREREAAGQSAEAASSAAGSSAAESSAAVAAAKQILFGDFHVHTTISFDAFMLSLPAIGGEGAHPPADACDFARYCSALDFWSINDHAEAITPQAWADTRHAIRQCNARAGDPTQPDSVAFLGWEWTQVGDTPQNHYGHKNVVLAGEGEGDVPARPIAAGGRALAIRENAAGVWTRGLLALGGGGRMHDFAQYWSERAGQPRCPADVPSPQLPPDCLEVADTPADLFRKLEEWGHDSLVIPHGTAWGLYTPPRSDWKKQLGAQHNPARQTLLEVYSGHGASEKAQPWRAVNADENGALSCPQPTPNYFPACWRAGEIIQQRCLAEGESAAACESRARKTRQMAAEAGALAHLVVAGETPADWLDAGQCRDCILPAFNFRPGGAAQYMLALGNFAQDPSAPQRFRFGFIGSSDNHFARPGTGYKEYSRAGNTESNTPDIAPDSLLARTLRGPAETPSALPQNALAAAEELSGFQLAEMDRQASYFMTGGLVAAHSEGRSREQIWQAVKRREVYATSGPRMLLWFDLLNAPEQSAVIPMGGETQMYEAPIFRVRAAGSFEQLPGCPADSIAALSPQRLQYLCRGECYNPGDTRRQITRVEVVRIRPQRRPGEDINYLVEDPWRSFACGSPEGCSFTFTDPEFPGQRRDTVYYARAVEAPAPAINAAGVNCKYDENGRCTETQLCTAQGGDCLAPHEPHAWSSPIFVDYTPPPAKTKTALAYLGERQ